MKSKTPHSEIIYMLNPGNNVRAGPSACDRARLRTDSSISLVSRLQCNRWRITEAIRPLHKIDIFTSGQVLALFSGPAHHPTEYDRCRLAIQPHNASVKFRIGIGINISSDCCDRHRPGHQIRTVPAISPFREQDTASVVTDWKELNKIYKLQIPVQPPQWERCWGRQQLDKGIRRDHLHQRRYEACCCISHKKQWKKQHCLLYDDLHVSRRAGEIVSKCLHCDHRRKAGSIVA